MEDQTEQTDQDDPTKQLIRYGSKKIRIGADIPRELKTRLSEAILPGMLSAVIRELLEGYLTPSKEKGTGVAMKAVLKSDLSVHTSISPRQEGNTL